MNCHQFVNNRSILRKAHPQWKRRTWVLSMFFLFKYLNSLFLCWVPRQLVLMVHPQLVFSNMKAEGTILTVKNAPSLTVDRYWILPFCASSLLALFSSSSHVYSQQACSISLAHPPTHKLTHTVFSWGRSLAMVVGIWQAFLHMT